MYSILTHQMKFFPDFELIMVTFAQKKEKRERETTHRLSMNSHKTAIRWSCYAMAYLEVSQGYSSCTRAAVSYTHLTLPTNREV